jgi:predicted nucleic acid-binding protein
MNNYPLILIDTGIIVALYDRKDKYSHSHSSEVQAVIIERIWTQINADNFVLH